MGARDAWEEAGTQEGAVKGGGIYRAAATCRCGWGHVSQGPGLGMCGWQGRRHGWVQEVLDGACILVVGHCCCSW